MATYVPNATQTTEPVESQTVESAALEFRTLKTRVNALAASVAADDLTDLRVPEASVAVLPAVADRAGKVLGFDAGGDPTMVEVAGATDPSLRTDLAASSGASLVGYLPVGTGAVATGVQAKLRESVSPADFDAVGDGTTDDTTALQNWAASSLKKVGLPLTYKVTGTITFNAVGGLEANGMVIDGSAGGTWTSGTVVLYLGSLTALPALSTDYAKDAKTLVFASAHGLSNGDVFLIYNTTDSSWSTIRAEYRAGEFCQAGIVTSATGVTLTNPLYDSYTAAAVSLYKMARTEVNVKDLTVKGPTAAGVIEIKTSLCSKVRLTNVNAPNANYLGIYFDRCYDVETHGVNADVPQTAVTDAYGMLVGNSQNVRVFGGQLFSKRAGFDIGGDDLVGCVPSRNVQLIGATVGNDFSSSFPAVDLHGNLEGFKASKCVIYGGGAWGGVDNEYEDCDFRDAPSGVGALIIGGSEWLGGTAKVSGGKMRATTVFTTAVVRIVGNTTAKKDTTIIVKDVEADIGANTIFVKTEMAASTYKMNPIVDGITFSYAPSLSQVLRCQGTGAAGDGDMLVVDNITKAPAGVFLYISANSYGAATPARLMTQHGSASVELASAAVSTSVTATYKYSYGSKIPKIALAIDTRIVGANPLAVAYRSKNASACTFDIFTTNAANAGATPTVTVDYAVGLTEV